jgi:DNA-binding NarL/FixJ family response regulator
MVIHSDGHVPFRRVTLGLEATRQILAANPAANVIILSAQTDDVDLESLTTVGAVGVWAEQTAAGILAEAIREVRKGRRFFSPALVTRLAARNLGARRPNDPVPAGRGRRPKERTATPSTAAEVPSLLARDHKAHRVNA